MKKNIFISELNAKVMDFFFFLNPGKGGLHKDLWTITI